jgi:hypothetical protein
VLLELFTSEGCSSCPSADEVLADLDDGGDHTIALAFHVDYWNELGWVDRFSRPAWTERQQGYSRSFRTSRMYTPQLIVNGVTELVGSSRRDAGAAIEAASRAPRTTTLALSIASSAPGKWNVSYDAIGAPGDAELHLATARRRDSTDVPRGENAGRTLRHVHVVSELVTVPAGRGSRWISRPDGDAELVGWVQSTTRAATGGLPVLAAARVSVAR